MYIRVRLLNGLQKPLKYKVPDTWSEKNLEGNLIKVPLQKRYEFAAYIEKCFTRLTAPVTYANRSAVEKDIIPVDPHYLPFLKEKEHTEHTSTTSIYEESGTTQLTEKQQHIVKSITPQITEGTYYPALLHGVTGSGKTEIYKRLIQHAWNEGKGSLFLFPEISLAVKFSQLLQQQLPSSMALFSFHSATSIKEKRALWHHLMENKAAVILGVHLPMLLPLPHLGLIILDEEHDTGYQCTKHPRVSTKEAAFLRAQCSSIPIVAGSATPSISSLYNVSHKGWHLFELKKRFAGTFPRISIIKLTTQKNRKHFWISSELHQAIAEQLTKKEQTIIFLNRRGYSFFIQCKSCGFVPHCKNCAVSLTLHKNETLLCHDCSFALPLSAECSSCKATKFLKKGLGTQQIVTILEKLFPQARIARADLDTTVNNKK